MRARRYYSGSRARSPLANRPGRSTLAPARRNRSIARFLLDIPREGGIFTFCQSIYSIKDSPPWSSSPDLDTSLTSKEEGFYSLRLAFTKPGNQTVMAEFVIQEDSGREYPVSVPVRYEGRPPAGKPEGAN